LKDREHYPWLDWLRFAAAAMVLAVHARGVLLAAYGDLPLHQKGPVTAAAFAFTRLGNEAVIVFFVLSGFFVAGKGIERLVQGRFSVRDYAVDRITRIYVPYLPVLFLSLLAAWALETTITGPVFVSHVFGLQGVTVGSLSFKGNGALWSLGYEIWFYVLLGAVAAFVQYRNGPALRQGLATTVLGIALAVFCILYATYLLCWIVGGFAYFYRPVKARPAPLLAAFGLIVLGTVGNQVLSASESVNVTQWAAFLPPRSVCQLLLAAGIGVLIPQLACLEPRTSVSRSIERTGTWLAAFSYTLYLTHLPVLRLLSKSWGRQGDLSVASLSTVVAACGLCLVVAWLLYLPLERQTPKVRRWLRGCLLRPNTATTVPVAVGIAD